MITYGVVSRALTFNNTLDFTFRSVFTVVIYQPYWFLYSMVDDEKKKLDGRFYHLCPGEAKSVSLVGIISNATTAEEVSETIVNLSLLVFHMLIINILMLNLLIAVFKYAFRR